MSSYIPHNALEYIRYIKQKFPSLNKLNIGGNSSAAWDPMSRTVMEEILSYIFSIPIYYFSTNLRFNLGNANQIFDVYSKYNKTREVRICFTQSNHQCQGISLRNSNYTTKPIPARMDLHLSQQEGSSQEIMVEIDKIFDTLLLKFIHFLINGLTILHVVIINSPNASTL